MEIVRGDLQVFSVEIYGNAVSHEHTSALCGTGLSHTWVDRHVFEKTNLYGEKVTIHVANAFGTSLHRSQEKSRFFLSWQRPSVLY